MNNKLSVTTRVIIACVCIVLAVIGFMVKLPSGFHRIDKTLHSLFYFCAAGFFHVLFGVRRLWVHVLVFAALFLFGVGIEYAQESYNRWFHVRIHGRFDPEDVRANVKGLLMFSGVWGLWRIGKMMGRGVAESGKVATLDRE